MKKLRNEGEKTQRKMEKTQKLMYGKNKINKRTIKKLYFIII